jgi:hypothetical protein
MSEAISAIGAAAGGSAPAVEVMSQAALRATLAPGAQRWGGTTASPSGLQDVAKSLGDFSNRMFAPDDSSGPGAMLASVERAALSSFKRDDYLKTVLVATDLSVHVSMSMMKFHLSTSLGSAATGLFNTLLKNRE